MSIKGVIDRTTGRVDGAVRKLTLDVFSSVVKMTPVDTGRAKGNWIPTIGTRASGETNVTDKSGGSTIAVIVATVPEKAGAIVWLTNNVPYIGVLEYGRGNGKPGSQQAPNGMVRLSIQRFVK